MRVCHCTAACEYCGYCCRDGHAPWCRIWWPVYYPPSYPYPRPAPHPFQPYPLPIIYG